MCPLEQGCSRAAHHLHDRQRSWQQCIESDPGPAPRDPVGLILNELISNAFKPAHPAGHAGTVVIRVASDRDAIELGVSDDGIGLPDPLPPTPLGLRLVHILTDQVRDSLRLQHPPETSVVIRFHAAEARERPSTVGRSGAKACLPSAAGPHGLVMRLLLWVALSLPCVLAAGQTIPEADRPPAAPAAEATGGTVHAVRAATPPVIDGRVEEDEWSAAPKFEAFILNEPTEGGPGSEPTEVRVEYDDHYLFVAFRCFDSRPAEISATLGRRDSEPASDFVLLLLSPSGDRRTATRFFLNAGGVQADSLIYNDKQNTWSWDAVWRGEVARFEGGWSAEMAIPLYAVGGFDAARPTWGFLARRYIARTHERVSSTLVPRSAPGYVSLFGTLTGVEEIAPRRALEVTPYVAARAAAQPGASDPSRSLSSAADLGIDLAYHLGRGLDLNATLNPDFGQVEVDQIVLNLSTFETFYPEKRPFFTQRLELFEPVGGPDFEQLMSLFYSRRIGAEAPIIAAAKLTGTPLPGLSLGVLDAMVTASRPLHAEAGDEPAVPEAPTINYLAAVGRVSVSADSWIGARLASATPLSDGATGGNAVAIDTTLRPTDSDWGMFGQAAVSQAVGGPEERTLLDGTVLKRGQLGLGAYARAGKTGGVPRFQVGYDYVAPELELNAVGFERDSNLHRAVASAAYFRLNGLGPLHSFDATLAGSAGWSADGRGLVRERSASVVSNAILPGFHTLQWQLLLSAPVFDLRELRQTGVALQMPAAQSTSVTAATDPNLALSVSASATLRRQSGDGVSPSRYDWALGGGFAVRPSPAFETRLDVAGARTLYNPRYVATLEEGHFLLGRLDAVQLSATLRQQWVVTRALTFQAYLQLLNAYGDYGPFFEARGSPADPVTPSDLVPASEPMMNPDFHSTRLAVNLIGRWEYRPGSTLYLVYTRNQQELLSEIGRVTLGSSTLFQGPAVDVLFLKCTWFWTG
jgi:hypothetical protein